MSFRKDRVRSALFLALSALLFLALSGMFMLPGRKGLAGRGALLVGVGLAVPVLYVVLGPS